MAETPEKEPQAETPSKETQPDKQPAAPNGRSSRMPAIVVSVSALIVIGAAALYALPNFNTALPNFSSFAELFSGASKPDPMLATLKDIQSGQQQTAAALHENGAALQRNAAVDRKSVV